VANWSICRKNRADDSVNATDWGTRLQWAETASTNP
jgi:hypothetical protein